MSRVGRAEDMHFTGEAEEHLGARGASASAYIWPGAVSLAVLLAIAAGGSTQAASFALLLLRLACAVLLALGMMRLWQQDLSRSPRLAIVLMLLVIGLVALHLVPFPVTLHGMLPGRSFVSSIYDIIGIAPSAMPITLSPAATWDCLLALLPPVALFVATLTIPPRFRWMPAAAILAGAAASVLLGLAQRFEGPQSGLYIHAFSNFGSATGFFANRNHFAALLCVAIPLTWGLSLRLYQRPGLPGFAALAFGALMMVVILMGLAAAASRAGIFLGMLALLLSTFMLWSPGGIRRRSSKARITSVALIAAALLIGQFGMVGILRLAETDPLTEYRATIAEVTLKAAADFFPFGSGLGTFRPVYAMYESPAAMTSAYINHAHNDWLELWLEGGLPAALLAAAFLALFASQCWRVWSTSGRHAHSIIPRAASIGILVLLLHSAVDYPLRMPALASVFAVLLGLLFAEQALRSASEGRRSRRSQVPQAAGLQPAVFTIPPAFKVQQPQARMKDGRQ
ncbi:MAG: O-antigen ligase family protein [Aestuariivirga sp.]|nr:O-antigen ligase family protein [Aestuariivirga sp.]